MKAEHKPQPKRILLLIGGVLLLLALLFWYFAENTAQNIPEDSLVLIFFDCKQADCFLIQTPDGKNMLIDTGSADTAELLLARLERLGIRALDYLILTHGHFDHIGSAASLLATVPAAHILIPGEHFTDPTEYGKLSTALTDAAASGSEIVCLTGLAEQALPLAFSFGTAVCTVFPSPLYTDDQTGDNSDSLTVRLDYGSRSFLFCADNDGESEAALLTRYGTDCFDADLMKVAHHGSASATTAPWLSAVTPRIAIISCGWGNPYGHPEPETLRRLEDAGATILRTDLSGDITLWCDGERIGQTDGSVGSFFKYFKKRIANSREMWYTEDK